MNTQELDGRKIKLKTPYSDVVECALAFESQKPPYPSYALVYWRDFESVSLIFVHMNDAKYSNVDGYVEMVCSDYLKSNAIISPNPSKTTANVNLDIVRNNYEFYKKALEKAGVETSK